MSRLIRYSHAAALVFRRDRNYLQLCQSCAPEVPSHMYFSFVLLNYGVSERVWGMTNFKRYRKRGDVAAIWSWFVPVT